MRIPNIIQLFRIPFSLSLTPIFLFAVSMADTHDLYNIGLLFIALHFFIYPAGFAFNSYMDQDEGSIGGLKNPPKAGRGDFYLSLLFEGIGLGICYFMNPFLAEAVLLYVLVSLAYSWHGIRLKRYPIFGFCTIVFFQGFYVFSLVYIFTQNQVILDCIFQTNFILPAIISSILIAGIFPLTQVYQHKADAKVGEKSFSMLLGIKGTFQFSGICFILTGMISAFHFIESNQSHLFYVFLLFIFPIITFFLWWAAKVWERYSEANYRQTMTMLKITTICLNSYFLGVSIIKNLNELPF